MKFIYNRRDDEHELVRGEEKKSKDKRQEESYFLSLASDVSRVNLAKLIKRDADRVPS